jgi:hypothetical protein
MRQFRASFWETGLVIIFHRRHFFDSPSSLCDFAIAVAHNGLNGFWLRDANCQINLRAYFEYQFDCRHYGVLLLTLRGVDKNHVKMYF